MTNISQNLWGHVFNCTWWLHLILFILPQLASQKYWLQSISVKLIYQFLYLSNFYLFYRCLEKVFKEERNQNKKGNSRGVTTNMIRWKENRKVKDQNNEILGFDLMYFLPRIISSSLLLFGCFQKVIFQEFNLVI